MFTLFEGELEFACPGKTSTFDAGFTFNVSSDAPHALRNVSDAVVRMLCMAHQPDWTSSSRRSAIS